MLSLPGRADGVDAVKHSVRSLKKLECKIRFNAAAAPEGRRLVWDEFFDLRSFVSKRARYPLAVLCGMDRESLRGVADEFFFYVYYRFYRENGIAQASLFDPELLGRFGLPHDADKDAVKRKFRELAMRYHPDHGGEAGKFMEMMEMYRKIMEE
ncbi:MAG: DnaJ domain-containing protein [Clostridiaceae bacterium]|nr:DnaJ domain-containing protein [Eubacteriales bacterium]